MSTVLSTLAQRLSFRPRPSQAHDPDADGRHAPGPVAPAAAAAPALPDALRRADDALGRVVLSYMPVLDRHQTVMGTRVTVHAIDAVQSRHMEALVQAISRTWPEETKHQISLNMADHRLARALLRLRPPRNILIEVPAPVALERQSRQHLDALQANGNLLQIKDCASSPIPAELLGCFRFMMASLSEPINNLPSSAQPAPDLVRTDVQSLNGVQAAFTGGATAVTGWPMATPLQAARLHTMRTHSRTPILMELLQRVQRGDSAAQLEHVFAQDPTAAYKLLRFVNSATFCLPSKVVAIRDAITLIGQQKLTHWILLMLSAASRQHMELRTTTYAAVRRGALMEELGRASGQDTRADELFACGMFSLIDRMLGQPMRELLQAISPPEDVWDALINQGGPFDPYLRLARAVERRQQDVVRQAGAELGLPLERINHSILSATARVIELQ